MAELFRFDFSGGNPLRVKNALGETMFDASWHVLRSKPSMIGSITTIARFAGTDSTAGTLAYNYTPLARTYDYPPLYTVQTYACPTAPTTSPASHPVLTSPQIRFADSLSVSVRVQGAFFVCTTNTFLAANMSVEFGLTAWYLVFDTMVPYA